ncbi:MAG: DUF4406 domain-containing protein [Bacteroidaceae bacterium]|nr:DUF4406 domain-containing protein [Bacteroidaceae bacterium]
MRAYTTGAMEEHCRLMSLHGIRPKVFISGRVSDLPYLVAYGNFSNAERTLASMGYEVVNPMKICKKNWSWLRCMIKCLWAITFCDKIYQLDNWKESRGARIEYKWAKFLRKRIL